VDRQGHLAWRNMLSSKHEQGEQRWATVFALCILTVLVCMNIRLISFQQIATRDDDLDSIRGLIATGMQNYSTRSEGLFVKYDSWCSLLTKEAKQVSIQEVISALHGSFEVAMNTDMVGTDQVLLSRNWVLMVHFVGVWAAGVGMQWTEEEEVFEVLFSYDSMSLLWGAPLHGALWSLMAFQHAEGQEKDAAFVIMVKRICDRSPDVLSLMCYHGSGHGMALTVIDAPKSIRACMMVKHKSVMTLGMLDAALLHCSIDLTPLQQFQCFQGVHHSFLQSGPWSRKFIEEGPHALSPCENRKVGLLNCYIHFMKSGVSMASCMLLEQDHTYAEACLFAMSSRVFFINTLSPVDAFNNWDGNWSTVRSMCDNIDVSRTTRFWRFCMAGNLVATAPYAAYVSKLLTSHLSVQCIDEGGHVREEEELLVAELCNIMALTLSSKIEFQSETKWDWLLV